MSTCRILQREQAKPEYCGREWEKIYFLQERDRIHHGQVSSLDEVSERVGSVRMVWQIWVSQERGPMMQ